MKCLKCFTWSECWSAPSCSLRLSWGASAWTYCRHSQSFYWPPVNVMSRNQTDPNMIKCLNLIRYKKVVTPWNLLHNVTLNQVILQNSHSVINQDGWLGGLGRKLGKSIWKIKKVLLQSCSWSLLGVSSCRQSWSWERLSSVQPADTNPWNIPGNNNNTLVSRKLPTTTVVPAQ